MTSKAITKDYVDKHIDNILSQITFDDENIDDSSNTNIRKENNNERNAN